MSKWKEECVTCGHSRLKHSRLEKANYHDVGPRVRIEGECRWNDGEPGRTAWHFCHCKKWIGPFHDRL